VTVDVVKAYKKKESILKWAIARLRSKKHILKITLITAELQSMLRYILEHYDLKGQHPYIVRKPFRVRILR
jgi:hypothetical protein